MTDDTRAALRRAIAEAEAALDRLAGAPIADRLAAALDVHTARRAASEEAPRVGAEDGAAALSTLFGGTPSPEPVPAPTAPESPAPPAPPAEPDTHEARLAAWRAEDSSTPTPEAAPASSEPDTDAALRAALTEGDTDS
jgi:hypothetical protein